jgi:hypothetical protein
MDPGGDGHRAAGGSKSGVTMMSALEDGVGTGVGSAARAVGGSVGIDVDTGDDAHAAKASAGTRTRAVAT